MTAARRDEQRAMRDVRGDREVPDGVPPPAAGRHRSGAVRTMHELHRAAPRSHGGPESCRSAALAHLRGTVLLSTPASAGPGGHAGDGARSPKKSDRDGPGALRSSTTAAGASRCDARQVEGSTFADELVEAAAALIREQWKPDPSPHGSRACRRCERPEQVPDFADAWPRRSASPSTRSIRKVGQNRPQSDDGEQRPTTEERPGSVRGGAATFPPGPVLLIDDTVDSGWTLTVVGARSREAGAARSRPSPSPSSEPGDHGPGRLAP